MWRLCTTQVSAPSSGGADRSNLPLVRARASGAVHLDCPMLSGPTELERTSLIP
jgi:hypothetical protein